MFLILKRLIEMINYLDLLYWPFSLKRHSIPDDMFEDPQNDALDDDLLLLL
jgi:hypothetical protein